MLLIPAFRRVGSVTVYADDEIWYRFYLLPSVPAVRLDAHQKPVFLVVKYAFGDDARAADPNLPNGAGYVAFDVNLAVSQTEEDAARQELQDWVDAEFARRKADDAWRDHPDYQGPDAPQVLFADPTWAGGLSRMLAPQSEALVSARVAEQPASLLHGNTAVFNMDLTSSGATFLYDLLVGEDEGGSDLTPIQVVYDLVMWARLPPVTIKITADSQRVYEQVKKIEETDRDNPCTRSEIETYREKGINSARLEEQGSVTIQIDKGDASVSDEVLDEIREYALHLFDSMLERTMLEPAPQDEDELAFEDELHPDGGRSELVATLFQHNGFGGESIEITEDVSSFVDLNFNDRVSSLRVRSGHRVTLYEHVNYAGRSKTYTSSTSEVGSSWNDRFSSARIYRPPTTRYRVRKTYNEATMRLDIELSQSQVVEWPVVAQATLQTFFAGMSASEITQFARELRLDDPMFQTLGLTVRALADFDNEPISFVTAEVKYGERVESFTFDEESPGAQRWSPSLIEGSRTYRSRWRVGYDGHDPTPWSEWERGTAQDLNIAVADPGKLEVVVLSGSVDFELVKSVTVTLSYADPDQGIEPLTHPIILDAATPSGAWTRRLFKPVTQPVNATVQYHLSDGKTIDGEPLSSRSGQLMVPTPVIDVLDVALVPSGDWSDVSMVLVQLSYTDAAGRVFDAHKQFTAMDQFATWKVLLQDPNRRTFKHKKLITYKTGTVDDQPWERATGDQAIPIHVPGVPRLSVNVFANLVDFAVAAVVQVTLSRGDASHSLSFTSATSANWTLPLPEGEEPSYTYTITYHQPDGGQQVLGPVTTRDTELYIPRLQVPDSGAIKVTVRGQLVDFAVSPLVEVVLTYKDPGNGIDLLEAVTLSADAKTAEWSFEVADVTRRTFHYATTYFLPDGTAVPGEEGDSSVPNVIVKSHQPS